MGYENVTDRDALAGELLADARHECNNQLAFVISNLQNLIEYADDLVRVIEAHRARASSDELDRLEAEVDLPFLLEDAGRAAREGLSGALRLRDILGTLAGLASDEPVVDACVLVRDVVGLMRKAIALRATLTLEAIGEAKVTSRTTPLTRAVLAMVKHGLSALEPARRLENRLRIAVARRDDAVEIIVERSGGEGHGLDRVEHAAAALGARLSVEPTRLTLALHSQLP